MNEIQPRPGDSHSSPDGLWRWLLGGLLGGGIVLGLMVAAYAIGYHRGQHHPRIAAAGPTTVPNPTTTTAPNTTAALPPRGPIQNTPALLARGRPLYSTKACSGCHSLSGTASVGPSLKGVAGSKVTLSNGQTITADDAYLRQSIANPDAQIVKGYRAGVMSAAVASFNLAGKPDEIRALVAFIKSQK
jgi:cytochrome c2